MPVLRGFVNMELIRRLTDLPSFPTGSVVTMGSFDGFHQGHQALMRKLRGQADALKLPMVLMTFEPLPKEYFQPNLPGARLIAFTEKWHLAQSMGFDYFMALPFDKALANLPAETFIHTILVDILHVKSIIVGNDFRFGAKRLGDVELLKKSGEQCGFSVESVSDVLHDHQRISSTRIREAVMQGDFSLVKMLLGRPFCVRGRVTYGDQRGRELGYPTANIHWYRRLIPLSGIFVVLVHGLKKDPLPGIAYITAKPTLEGKQRVLEVHLFDFSETLYGKPITVEFLHKIRDDERFDSQEILLQQIHRDVEEAKQYFLCGEHIND